MSSRWYIKNGWAKVGGAWKKTRADGSQFLSISITDPDQLPRDEQGRASLSLMKNNYKENDNHPDYVLSVRIEGDAPKAQGKPKPVPKHEPITEDDIPFDSAPA